MIYDNINTNIIQQFRTLNLKNQFGCKKIAGDMVYVHWHNSKGHRENMLMKGYTCLGVSVSIGKTNPQVSTIGTLGSRAGSRERDGENLIAFGIQVLAF